MSASKGLIDVYPLLLRYVVSNWKVFKWDWSLYAPSQLDGFVAMLEHIFKIELAKIQRSVEDKVKRNLIIDEVRQRWIIARDGITEHIPRTIVVV